MHQFPKIEKLKLELSAFLHSAKSDFLFFRTFSFSALTITLSKNILMLCDIFLKESINLRYY